MAEKPTILICNDDGVDAPGIRYLIDTVRPLGHVIAVAPTGPRSGQSSAISVNTPLRISKRSASENVEIYAVDGTPVDCVKLAMHTILRDRRVDIMLSGINHGSNAGNCIVYSGTMGAVLEACMLGIPAIGFSLLEHSWNADFSPCAPYIERITKAVIDHGLPEGVCLNVNIPAVAEPRGMKTVEAGRGYWTEEYIDYTDPQGKPFYYLSGRFIDQNRESKATDTYWLDEGYVTVVPVRPDPTAVDMIGVVGRLLESQP